MQWVPIRVQAAIRDYYSKNHSSLLFHRKKEKILEGNWKRRSSSTEKYRTKMNIRRINWYVPISHWFPLNPGEQIQTPSAHVPRPLQFVTQFAEKKKPTSKHTRKKKRHYRTVHVYKIHKSDKISMQLWYHPPIFLFKVQMNQERDHPTTKKKKEKKKKLKTGEKWAKWVRVHER